MKSLLQSAVGSFLLVATLCGASNSTSRVSIHIPFDLHHKEGEEHVKAEFGFKSHSGSIYAYVYYVESVHNFCNAIDWSSNGTDGHPKHTGGMKSPYILMTHSSGGCSAVTKARHAQQDGASALVIMNDACSCDDQPCIDKFGPECEEENNFFKMVNDGSASDVSIPSFLLNKIVSNNLTQQLKSNQPVLLELNWGLKTHNCMKEPPLEYSLWTTAHDPLLDLDTYKNLNTISKAMTDSAVFTPRFSLVDGSRFNCNKQAETTGPCDHLCTNHGRYCAVHGWELSGHAIVTETLRRLCIFKHYDSSTYLDYLLHHLEHCGTAKEYADEECLKSAMDAAKVNHVLVEQCFSDTGGLTEDKPNSLLQDQLELQERSGVVSLPAVTIGHKVLDDYSSWNIFEGICRHFYTRNLTTTPDICFKCAACSNTMGCLENNGHCVDFQKPEEPSKKKGESEHHKRHHGWTVFWMLLLGLGAGGGYYYYKKMQDNEGFGRPGGTLNSYFQLTGEDA